ncbi:stage II sporulation protein R [Clostridium rectalis]|uniref:stage II sporulation protein R n=1 Tax=Clostridium rectalis TaxID=2040295 RepID=UPI000F6392FC|nr:stage II sporulation protein R [Clostridium rectalis]
MRKKIVIITLILICGIGSIIKFKTSIYREDISSKLIRFHVIANSDLVMDQNLKLKVRDEVLSYMSPKLKQCNNINESRRVILENNKEIKNIAEKIIKQNGYDYSVETKLSQENFPVKTYGNITLPQGKYEAYRIIIGKGEGQNWWCVMFPPLCFVDITKGEVSYKETEKEMKQVLNDKEYETIDNTSNGNIKIKFKIAEVIKKALN